MDVRWKTNFEPHVTHKMSEWRTRSRRPANTWRLYRVRSCQDCELEQGTSIAGEYNDMGLETTCRTVPGD